MSQNKWGADLPDAQDQRLLDAVLDSWDRNNTLLLNLLRVLLEGGLEARAMEGSPSVSEMYTHIHHERMASVFENAPGVRWKGAPRKTERKRQGGAGCGKEQSGNGPGHEPERLPSDPPAPAPDLPRGLPSHQIKLALKV